MVVVVNVVFMSNINTKEFWDNIHEKEIDSPWRTYPTTFDFILKTLKLGTNGKVVELGCGTGVLAKRIIEECGNDYFGIDISGVSKEKIEHMGGHFTQADIMNLNIETKGFAGYLIATEFLEHFEDPEYIIKHTKQFLKEDGVAIFAVPNNILGHEDLEEHYQKFTHDSIKELFSKYYKVVKIAQYEEFFISGLTTEGGKEIVNLPILLVVASDGSI